MEDEAPPLSAQKIFCFPTVNHRCEFLIPEEIPFFFASDMYTAIFEKSPHSPPRALQQSGPLLVPVHSGAEQDLCAGHT